MQCYRYIEIGVRKGVSDDESGGDADDADDGLSPAAPSII